MLYAIVPLLLLLLCLALVNLLRLPASTVGANTPPVSAAEATVLPSATPEPSRTKPPLSTATIVPSPTPSSLPTLTPAVESTPQLPTELQIRLMGPPSGSSYGPGESVTFFWEWPLPLTEEQRLTLYLLGEDNQLQVGSLEASNLGKAYTIALTGEQLAGFDGALSWEVRLETESGAGSMLNSERRTFSVDQSR